MTHRPCIVKGEKYPFVLERLICRFIYMTVSECGQGTTFTLYLRLEVNIFWTHLVCAFSSKVV